MKKKRLASLALAAAMVISTVAGSATTARAAEGGAASLRDLATVSGSFPGYWGGDSLALLKDGDPSTYWNGHNDTEANRPENNKRSQWVMYDFGETSVDLKACTVNWQADGGGTLLPTSLKIEYDRDGVWTATQPTGEYTFEASKDNLYAFAPVTTTKIRMTMVNEGYVPPIGAAIFEWDVVAATKLEAAIAKAEEKQESDYTPESWADFSAALAAAKEIDEATAEQEAITAAIAALQEAEAALKDKGASDELIGELTSLVDAQRAKEEADYTEESWTQFAKAFQAAQAVLAGNDKPVAAVIGAKDALDAAVAALRTITLEERAAAIVLPGQVKQNFTVPVSYAGGAITVEWAVTDGEESLRITGDGTAVVTRSWDADVDAAVTATLKRAGKEDVTKNFVVKVLKNQLREQATPKGSYAGYGTQGFDKFMDNNPNTFWNGWGDASLTGDNHSQWLEYDFGDTAVEIGSSIVNWHDDNGGVLVPGSIEFQYQVEAEDGTKSMVPVEPIGQYTFVKDQDNLYEFEPVTTKVLRMTMTNERYGSGCGAAIREWYVNKPGFTGIEIPDLNDVIATIKLPQETRWDFTLPIVPAGVGAEWSVPSDQDAIKIENGTVVVARGAEDVLVDLALTLSASGQEDVTETYAIHVPKASEFRDAATVSASYAFGETLQGINDGMITSFWNGWGDASLTVDHHSQWVMYDFGGNQVKLDSCVVRWHDDNGGVLAPTGLKIEYVAENAVSPADPVWTEVTPVKPFDTFDKDYDNTYAFEEVAAYKIRMTMTNDRYVAPVGASIYEWDVTGSFMTPVTADKSGLSTAVSEAKEKYKEEDYTEGSWKVFSDALSKAERILLEDQVTQTQVDKAEQELADAIAQLEKKTKPIIPGGPAASQESLKKLSDDLAKAKSDYKKADYTPESFAKLEQVIVAVEEVLALTEIKQSQVDAAQKFLDDAVNGLVKIDQPVTPDQPASQESITKLSNAAAKAKEDYREAEYTPESWKKFADALLEAEKIAADQNATQAQVDLAQKNLDDAIGKLVKKQPQNPTASQESVTKLTAAVALASTSYQQKDYTPESWKTFEAALAEAKKVIADTKATQAQVDKAQNDLTNAIAGLVKKQAETQKPPKVKESKLTLGVKEKASVFKKGFTYKTSNKKYVSVDKKGVIKGVKKGKADVTVKNASGQAVQVYHVTVKNAPKKISKVSPAKKTLKKGKTVKIKVTLPKGTASKITFTSSNKKVATVNAKGVVKAKKKGKATITVKTFNKKTKKVKIAVK